MTKTNIKISDILLFIVLIAALIGVFHYGANSYKETVEQYSNTLEQSIEVQNKEIEKLEGIISTYLENNSIKHTIDTLKNKNESLVDEVVKYANETSDKLIEAYKNIQTLNDSLRYYKIYYDYSQNQFNHKYIVKPNASGGRNFSFEANAVSLSKYKECEKVQSKLTENLFEIKKLNMRYEHALKYYKIDISKVNNDEETFSIGPYYAPHIDSALVLLNVYRDKMKYDKKKKTWTAGSNNIFGGTNSIITYDLNTKATIINDTTYIIKGDTVIFK